MGKLFKKFKTRKQLKEELASSYAEIASLNAKLSDLMILERKRKIAESLTTKVEPKDIIPVCAIRVNYDWEKGLDNGAKRDVIKEIAERIEPYIKWEELYEPENLTTIVRGTLLVLMPRERGLDNGKE